ncbi:MAG: hypothetical protein ACXWCX_25950 [Burkholderiales bacterium]
MVIESRSRPDTPSWLSEGLVIYLSDPERVRREQVDVVALEKRLRSARTEPEMRAAYRDAAAAVAAAVKQHSLSTVLSWATDGVPARPY